MAGVLFTNNATVSKFNRIGTERGYGLSDVAMIRFGTMPDPDPNAVEPQMFCYPVGGEEAGYQETFSEGLQLMHNPWAKNPLELRALRGITEHQMIAKSGLKIRWASRSAGPWPRPGSTKAMSAGVSVKYRIRSPLLVSGNDRSCSS